MIRALLITCLTLLPIVGAAQTCVPPATPACLDVADPFEDQSDMNACQDELADYRNLVSEFAVCLRAKAKGVQDDALALSEKFRCRAGLEGACN